MMTAAGTDTVRRHIDLLPLTDFYRRGSSRRRLPEIAWIDGGRMPRPYRDLLVHESDMTPTLEEYYGSPLHIHVLNRNVEEGILSREVVLHLGDRERPVEFGAIKIHLDRFAEGPKRRILEGHIPLGAILREYEIDHGSHPTSFIRIMPDPLMMVALCLTFPTPLYGRCNRLTHTSGAPLAEVVEILPPEKGDGEGEKYL